MNPPTSHFYKPITSFRESAVMCGHDQCDALGSHQVEQELKDRGARLFIK
jgi:hypothetical protein